MTAMQLPFDFRFVWEGAKLAFPFVRRGIVPEGTTLLLHPLNYTSANLLPQPSPPTFSPSSSVHPEPTLSFSQEQPSPQPRRTSPLCTTKSCPSAKTSTPLQKPSLKSSPATLLRFPLRTPKACSSIPVTVPRRTTFWIRRRSSCLRVAMMGRMGRKRSWRGGSLSLLIRFRRTVALGIPGGGVLTSSTASPSFEVVKHVHIESDVYL